MAGKPLLVSLCFAPSSPAFAKPPQSSKSWIHYCLTRVKQLGRASRSPVVRSMPLEDARQFMNESSHGTKVPGGYEKRFSGYFTLTNALGKPIEVYFATTLHRGSAREPDPVEVAFLSTAVASQKKQESYCTC